jgi:2-oxoglutarate dehydrogenase complex dehydrogenase (E1) component-like enzyme
MTAAPKAIPASLNAWNADYLDEQYQRYKADPGSVSEAAAAFFAGFDLAMAGELVLSPGAGRSSGVTAAARNGQGNGTAATAVSAATSPSGFVDSPRFQPDSKATITPTRGQPAGRASHFQAVVDDLITSYREHGHLAAKIDPFDRERPTPRDADARLPRARRERPSPHGGCGGAGFCRRDAAA